MNLEVQLLKNGDQRTFSGIVNSCWGRFNKFAQIYTSDEEVAKELVQDTFLSLWDNREKLSDDTAFIPFLMVILRNKCLNYLKQKKVETLSIDELSLEMIYYRANIHVIENEASTLLDAEDLHWIINRAMNQLPDKTKEIFRLSRYEGLSNKEIAEQLNVSIKTIEFHITKSLQHLRKNVPKEYFFALLILMNTS